MTLIAWLIAMVVIPVLVNVISNDLGILIPIWLAKALRRAAGKLRETDARELFTREWIAESSSRPGVIWKLRYAVPILLWGHGALQRQVHAGAKARPRTRFIDLARAIAVSLEGW